MSIPSSRSRPVRESLPNGACGVTWSSGREGSVPQCIDELMFSGALEVPLGHPGSPNSYPRSPRIAQLPPQAPVSHIISSLHRRLAGVRSSSSESRAGGSRSDRGGWWVWRGGVARVARARSVESVGSKRRQAAWTRQVATAGAVLTSVDRSAVPRARALPQSSRCRLAPAPAPPWPTPPSSSAPLRRSIGASTRPRHPLVWYVRERSLERAPQLARPPPLRSATRLRRSIAVELPGRDVCSVAVRSLPSPLAASDECI